MAEEAKEPELLPCLCGKIPIGHAIEPHTHHFAKFMPDYKGGYVIECACGIGTIHDTFDDNKAVAIAHWNKRAFPGVQFRSAVSGLLYTDPDAAGSISEVIVNGRPFTTIGSAVLQVQRILDDAQG